MFIVAPRWPGQIGNAVLGATVIRLLGTMGCMAAYQIIAAPHDAAFLFWATVIYMILLAVDVTFGVIAIQKHYRSNSNSNSNPGTAS